MKKTVLCVLVAGSLLATSCKEAKKGATDLKDATIETAGKAADATTEAAEDVANGAKDAANTVAEGASNATDAVVDGAKDAANTVAEGASSAANTVAEGAKEAVSGAKDSALEGVTIPEFSNEAVTENLTKYAAYAKNYIAANGNMAKIAALAPKGAALLAKGKELASNLNATELAKYKSVLSTIQSKMAASK